MIKKPLGYQQITSLGTAVALTVPAGAQRALLQAETQNVRWRDDGTDPTTAAGMILKAGNDPVLYEGDLSAIKVIEVTSSAKLNVTYFT